MNKKYLTLFIVIVGLSILILLKHVRSTQAEPVLNSLVQSTSTLHCAWQDPQPVDEGFFPGATDASSPLLQFRQGYSRLGRCTRGVVAALVLVYEDEQQASDAVHALVQDIPASAVAVSLTGTNDAGNQKKVWKVQGTEGT